MFRFPLYLLFLVGLISLTSSSNYYYNKCKSLDSELAGKMPPIRRGYLPKIRQCIHFWTDNKSSDEAIIQLAKMKTYEGRIREPAPRNRHVGHDHRPLELHRRRGRHLAKVHYRSASDEDQNDPDADAGSTGQA